MTPERPGTILLIHGAWLTPASWDGVRQRYEALGYTVLAPALGIGNGVWFRRSNRAPLLLITGEDDRTVDPAMVRATYRKYARSPAVTELKSFAGRPHWIIGAPGWEEVADYALGWATSH